MMSSVEERLTRIEEILGITGAGGGVGPTDVISSKVGQQIAADGSVTYDFDGHVSATGLDLPDSGTIIGEADSRVSWLRNAIQQSYLYGANDAAFEYLFLRANAALGRPGGSVNLRAGAKGGGGSTLVVSAHEAEKPKVQVQLEGTFMGFLAALLFDGNGRSSWPMRWVPGNPELEQPISIPDLSSSIRFNMGQSSINFVANSISGNRTIEHGLGTTPTIVLANCNTAPAPTEIPVMNPFAYGPVNVSFNGETKIAWTGAVAFAWLAIAIV